MYALEGSIAYASALVQWVRDNLDLIDEARGVIAGLIHFANRGGAHRPGRTGSHHLWGRPMPPTWPWGPTGALKKNWQTHTTWHPAMKNEMRKQLYAG